MKIANTLFVSLLLAGSFVSVPFANSISTTQDGEEQEVELAPVADMHHFMEYISKPSYRELKSLLAEEKIRRSAWKKVEQHALILAETTILVAQRPPEDATEEVTTDWHGISVDTYKHAVALYKAAGEKDQEVALEHYGLMMDACNACHSKYDENDHQLAK